MQPKIITLPDEIRDALERDFPPAPQPEDMRLRYSGPKIDKSRAREWVATHLFPINAPEHLAPFLREFQESFIGMTTGHTAPALVINNLPPTYGKSLMVGLAQMLGGRTSEEAWLSPDSAPAQTLHHDFRIERLDNSKHIQFMYCDSAGKERQPTNFVSADEVIERLAAETGVTSEQLVSELAAIRLAKRDCPALPFLSENPHWTTASDAPRYFGSTYGLDLKNAPLWTTDQGNKELLAAFVQCAETCASEVNPISPAATESNTLTVWNDGIIFHARGSTPDFRPQQGRLQIGLSSYPHVGVFESPNNTIHGIRCLTAPVLSPLSR